MDEDNVMRIRPVRTMTSESGEEIGIYPITSTDIAKLARDRGIQVEFDHDGEHRKYQVLEGADLWMPLIEVGSAVSIGIGTNLLTDFIKQLLRARGEDESSQQNVIVHVDFTIADADGMKTPVQLDGKAKDLLERIERFEDEYGRGEVNGEQYIRDRPRYI
jgi:hypothetical protein